MNRIIVHYGEGHGKTSSAIGMVARALAHGRKVLAIQFFKPELDSALALLKKSTPEHSLVTLNTGNWYFLNHPNPAYHDQFEETLQLATQIVRQQNIDFILLDELNYATTYQLLSAREILAMIQQFDQKIFVITGRYPHPDILDAADTVSEFKCIKHAYDQGTPAIAGVEY